MVALYRSALRVLYAVVQFFRFQERAGNVCNEAPFAGFRALSKTSEKCLYSAVPRGIV